MFTWLLIIFALAVVFGVIKVEQLKEWGNKAVAFVSSYMEKSASAKEKKEEDEKNSDQ